MVGFATADNLFGPARFVVGTIAGNGNNYTSIQAAINDAALFVSGIKTIYIKGGTYTENLVFVDGTHLHGVNIDGRIAGQVQIIGNHTFAPTAAGISTTFLENITFSATTGDAFTVSPAAGASAILACKYSEVDANDTGAHCVLLTPAVGGVALFACERNNFNSDGDCFESTTDNSLVSLTLSTCVSSNASIVALGGATTSCVVDYCQLTATTDAITTLGGGIAAQYSKITSGNAGVNFLASATFDGQHNTFNSSNGSGFYIDGAAGNYNYADVVLIGTAQDIAPGITETKQGWKPHADSGASPGTGVARGTAAFNSTDFTVTDGFVELAQSLSVNIQTFTSSGTYTPTTGMAYCVIEVVGGGGGSGGVAATGGGTVGSTGGGGGGGYSRKVFSAATIGASQTVTIGAAGTAGATGNNAGGTGGTTSVGALISATGGAGSAGSGVAGTTASVGAAGGVGSSGDFNTNGNPGGLGTASAGGILAIGGYGGSSFFGGGGLGSVTTATTAAANAATSYGGGAGGGASYVGVAGLAGAAGFAGIVVVTEYVIA